MSHGEECVLLHTYHVTRDEGIQPRCPLCFDDIYSQGERQDCDNCYGTTFHGGIKQAWRAWGLFTDADDPETIGKRGVWNPSERNLHTEHEPDLIQRDFVVRVSAWGPGHRVDEIEGIYVLKNTNNESLRTGNRFGQTQFDTVGQRADIQRVAEAMGIYKYPVIGRVFERFDGRPR